MTTELLLSVLLVLIGLNLGNGILGYDFKVECDYDGLVEFDFYFVFSEFFNWMWHIELTFLNRDAFFGEAINEVLRGYGNWEGTGL